jgi:hypothetical protein
MNRGRGRGRPPKTNNPVGRGGQGKKDQGRKTYIQEIISKEESKSHNVAKVVSHVGTNHHQNPKSNSTETVEVS